MRFSDLSFSRLAEISTGRAPTAKGLWQPLSTIVSLLLLALVITTGQWLWVGMAMQATPFLTSFLIKAAAIAGVAVLNFWFRREITNVVLSAKDIVEGHAYELEFVSEVSDLEKISKLEETKLYLSVKNNEIVYKVLDPDSQIQTGSITAQQLKKTLPSAEKSERHKKEILEQYKKKIFKITTQRGHTKPLIVPTIMDEKDLKNMRRMVKHLCAELNVYFKEKYPETHQDLPVPVLQHYTNNASIDIITVEGRTPNEASLFFSTAALSSKLTNLTQPELAALIQIELIKIYFRRSASNTLVNIGLDLAATLANVGLAQGNSFLEYLFKGISFFVILPLQFCFFLQKAILRSYEYHAIYHVADKDSGTGRGKHFVEASNKKVNSYTANAPSEPDKRRKRENNRAVYYPQPSDNPGFFRRIIQDIQEFVNKHAYLTDNQNRFWLFTLLDVLVDQIGLFFNELIAKARNTNTNNYAKKLTGYDKAETNKMAALEAAQEKLNRRLYEKIPVGKRYRPISPGFVGGPVRPHKNDPDRSPTHLNDIIDGLYETIPNGQNGHHAAPSNGHGFAVQKGMTPALLNSRKKASSCVSATPSSSRESSPERSRSRSRSPERGREPYFTRSRSHSPTMMNPTESRANGKPKQQRKCK